MSSLELKLFIASIGGAIMGMLLTILVLAVINGGTLGFNESTRISALEQKIEILEQR